MKKTALAWIISISLLIMCMIGHFTYRVYVWEYPRAWLVMAYTLGSVPIFSIHRLFKETWAVPRLVLRCVLSVVGIIIYTLIGMYHIFASPQDQAWFYLTLPIAPCVAVLIGELLGLSQKPRIHEQTNTP